jgi:hypothetical protein
MLLRRQYGPAPSSSLLLIQLCNGLALLPCFAVSLLLGGVPASAFVAAAVFIPNLTMLTLTICLAASTLSRDEDGAMVIAGGIGALIGLGTPALYFASVCLSTFPWGQDWLLLSPLYGYSLISNFFTTGTPAMFWLNSVVTACYLLLLATGAAWLLRRTWREESGSARLGISLITGNGIWARFGSKRRVAERAFLDLDPYLWFALRDRRSVRLAWAAVTLLAAAWFAAVALWPKPCGTLLAAVFTALLMYGVVGLMAMFSAAKVIGEDRRSGG